MKEKDCKECGKIFIPDSPNGTQLYCSRNCRKKVKARQLSVRTARQKVTGIIHGRPIKEYKYLVYKNGAKKRGFAFNLSQEQFDLFWQKPCHYCQSEIETVGIDRKDNKFGYHIENIVSCCTWCNTSKRHTPYQEFIDRCIKIAGIHTRTNGI